jgi:hypothetical protein
MSTRALDVILAASLLLVPSAAVAQHPPPGPQNPKASAPQAPVEKLGPNLFRVGNIRVDTARREITVAGTLNRDAQVLEFFANSRGGLKAYESALTLDTDAISFNVALVLIGLDRANAKASQGHFDPAPVSGDRVSITVEYTTPKGVERGPVEKLLYDKASKSNVPPGEWVYTGSTFYPDGRYAAAADGVLIGFAHTPSSIIESVTGIGLGRYGTIVPHPGLFGVTNLTLRIAALPDGDASRGKR